MADVHDVQGYRKKYERQMALLEEAEIDERDRDQIRRFVIHLRTNDPDVESLGTVVNHLNRVRKSAERAPQALVDFESVDDVNALKLHLNDTHGLSSGTIRNYMKGLRKFFRWSGVDWSSEITIGSSPERKHDPAENITQDDLQALFTAANEFETATRDKALIALLRDTGLRIGAALSLQLKHVNFEGRRGTVTINEEANVKGASGSKPVTWSRGYVGKWYDVHPRQDDPEAPLFCHIRQTAATDDDGALSQQYAGRRIKMIAEQAGLDRDRIHAHLFRGTAISEWIVDQMAEQTIRHRVDWDEDSRMFGVYSRVTEEEFNNAIFDHYGIDNDNDRDVSPPLDACPLCSTSLRGFEIICPRCASPLSQAAADALSTVEDTSRTYLVEEADREKRLTVSEMADAAKGDPTVAQELLDELSKLTE